MGLFRHFMTTIDYEKLIKMQASQETPFCKLKDVSKIGKEQNSPAKTKQKVFKPRNKLGR